MAKVCFETKLAGFDVQLIQHGKDNFKVRYGQQIRDRLTYANAAKELGEALMHAMACEGRITHG